MHAAMHAAGWACLLIIFAIAVWSTVEVVAPQWRRILSLATGNIEPVFAPLADSDAYPAERLA